jgi:hypothetical protein
MKQNEKSENEKPAGGYIIFRLNFESKSNPTAVSYVTMFTEVQLLCSPRSNGNKRKESSALRPNSKS